MQRLEVRGAVRPLQGSLGVKEFTKSLCEDDKIKQGQLTRRSKTINKLEILVKKSEGTKEDWEEKTSSSTLKKVFFLIWCENVH